MLTLYYHITITISLFFWVPLRAVRVFCHPHLTAPFTSDLGVPPGRLGGSTFIFVGLPRFVFGGNALYTFPSWMSLDRYSRTLPPPLPSDDLRPPPSYRRRGVVVGTRRLLTVNPDLAPGVGWRRGRRGRAGVAGLSFIGSWLWSDAPYARFVVVVELPDSPRFRAGGPYNVAPYLFLRRRPLTTLGHLPPTAVAESQWGEPRSDASGTSVGEEEGGVGQEWQAFSSLSLGRGAMVSIFPPPDSPRLRVGGPWSAAPYLFLRRRPLTTLGRPPPTAVAESQWGEPRSDAFGTGARVAVSISLWPVLLPVVGNRKEKETTEAYLSEDIVTVVACLLQCLQILCIINEFKAAAITYGLDKKSSRCLARSLFDPFTPMTFIIVWNGLYNANKEERNAVEERVQAHLVRRKLWRRKVKFAFMRPTGWHGESGVAESGGHITVDFCTRARVHVATHHVYCTEAAYGARPQVLRGTINITFEKRVGVWFILEWTTVLEVLATYSSRIICLRGYSYSIAIDDSENSCLETLTRDILMSLNISLTYDVPMSDVAPEYPLDEI
ncbi:hypothetical protein EDB85DRAFT_1895180 [Lactarius pseudohatsudake]|nr:hypothetical protein EDB85DRAFT_1895180 [Lactarius pseudohatsudake]